MTPARLHGLVAAAGTGGRMGFPKALLATSGGPPLALAWVRAMRTARADPVMVTLPQLAGDGPWSPRLVALRALLEDAGAVTNPSAWPARGLLGSIQTALRTADPHASLLFVPVDVPCVPAAVEALFDLHVRHPDAVVRAHVHGAPAHPVLLPAVACARVRGLGDGATVRDAFAGLEEARWDTNEAALAHNLNTPADLRACQPPCVPWDPPGH